MPCPHDRPVQPIPSSPHVAVLPSSPPPPKLTVIPSGARALFSPPQSGGRARREESAFHAHPPRAAQRAPVFPLRFHARLTFGAPTPKCSTRQRAAFRLARHPLAPLHPRACSCFPPIAEIHKQLILLAIAGFQLLESRLVAWLPNADPPTPSSAKSSSPRSCSITPATSASTVTTSRSISAPRTAAIYFGPIGRSSGPLSPPWPTAPISFQPFRNMSSLPKAQHTSRSASFSFISPPSW